MRFRDRGDAGRVLAGLLDGYRGRADALVLALPRGGVPVAVEVAEVLGAEMDVFLVRKLGVPGQPELAMGAIAGGVVILNKAIADEVDPEAVEQAIRREAKELERREDAYRGGRPPVDVGGRTVILVDDGMATGASARAAVEVLRGQGPKRIVVAVPTAPKETCDRFTEVVDEVVCVMTPEPFGAVGAAYRDFTQISDRQVRNLLR